VLTTHSGLQFGGEPIFPGKHEQAGLSPTARHSELGPQGEGIHGFAGLYSGAGGGVTVEFLKNV
jgi:hypothetical protein